MIYGRKSDRPLLFLDSYYSIPVMYSLPLPSFHAYSDLLSAAIINLISATILHIYPSSTLCSHTSLYNIKTMDRYHEQETEKTLSAAEVVAVSEDFGPGFTQNDKIDMQRMGKKQELNVQNASRC